MNPLSSNTQTPSAYAESGVDTASASQALRLMLPHIQRSWNDKVALRSLNHFANIVDVGGMGIAITMDGVGSKALIAQMMDSYDTIGIDCVAMNVNDLICVGALPVSMVDYIAVEETNPDRLEGIAIGLLEGARLAQISLVGGETAQLPDIIKGAGSQRGFDLVGTAIGHVELDRILTGQNVVAGDVVIGLFSNGIHSNGLSLARKVLLENAKLQIEQKFDELGCVLGEELLKPTEIYVKEAAALFDEIPTLKVLAHITGDGLLNLNRLGEGVGYILDDLPAPPAIFNFIQERGNVPLHEMYSVFNMGVGLCAVVGRNDADKVLSILAEHNRNAKVIGYAVKDEERRLYLPRHKLTGQGKTFTET